MRKSYYKSAVGWGWGFVLTVWALIILMVIGWFMNLVDLFHMTAILTGEGVIRIIGILVVPLGAIMGWFF